MRALKRFGMVPRKVTNCRAATTMEKLSECQQYHKELRSIVSKPSDFTPAEKMDPVWGRFKIWNRTSGDTVPLEYITGHFNTTWEPKGSKRVSVKCPSSELKKRYCSLHLTFAYRPKKKQFRPAVVFRGKGLRISAAEVEAYDKRVVVLWQPKAWVDSRVLSEITQALGEDQAKSYGLEEEMLWLGDNLHCQTTSEYRTEMRNFCNGLVKNYPPNTSDKGMAPVDNGLGFMVKHEIGVEQEKWLENEDNMIKWENNKMTASEKRVLLVKWIAMACDTCLSKEEMLYKYLAKAGAFMSVDGSGDEKIRPDGLPDGFKYEWDHVEIDSDGDEEEEDEEVVEAPDDDVVEADLAAEYEDISDRPEDLELSNEEPEIPDGFALVADCPDVTDSKKMLRTQVLFKWDCGWAQGVVKRTVSRCRQYNYFVQYIEDDGTTSIYRHSLSAANYWDESQGSGIWLCLEPDFYSDN